jgi:hypothetical protein
MHHAAPTSVAAALCAVALLASPARAEDRPDVDLRWTVSAADPSAAACPEEAHVRAAVERLTGRPLRSPGGARVPVRVDAAPGEGGAWAVRIAIDQPGNAAPRERRIEGPTCAEVAEAAAVVVAVALAGPGAVLGAPGAPAAAAPAPATAPRPAPLPSPPARPAPPAAEPAPDHDAALPAQAPSVHPGLRIAAGADFVSLPAPTFGAEAAFAIAFGENRVEILGSAWVPRSADAAGVAMASARISLLTAGARYCRTFLGGAIDLAGCAGLEAGALLGSSEGVTHPGSGSSPWVAPGLGLVGGWAFARRFRLVLELSGLVPVVRDSFQVGGLGELYRPPVLTARTLLGVEAALR